MVLLSKNAELLGPLYWFLGLSISGPESLHSSPICETIKFTVKRLIGLNQLFSVALMLISEDQPVLCLRKASSEGLI